MPRGQLLDTLEVPEPGLFARRSTHLDLGLPVPQRLAIHFQVGIRVSRHKLGLRPGPRFPLVVGVEQDRDEAAYFDCVYCHDALSTLIFRTSGACSMTLIGILTIRGSSLT